MPANNPSHPQPEWALASHNPLPVIGETPKSVAQLESADSVSVIIPVINECCNLRDAIQSVLDAGADEVIVVDGGSTDGSQELAKAMGVTVLPSKPGRAYQQNKGAACSSGTLLLFLHADSRLAPSAIEELLAKFQSSPHMIGGGFAQKIDHPRLKYRWLEKGNAWRATYQKLFYGDQGLFVRRSIFEQLGGFPEMPFLEDFEFSKRLSKLGETTLLRGPICVSARRWEENGVVWQTAKNWVTTLLYRIGVSAETLAASYRRHDESPSTEED